MIFNSLEFGAFFLAVFWAFFLTPPRFRWVLLLVCSYWFYMSWRAEYALLIAFSTVVDYVAGLKMHAAPDRRAKRRWLVLSLCSNLGLLFFFKYYDFFSTEARAALAEYSIVRWLPEWDFLLPVGISFYTFQTLSYTIDIYRGRLEPERHFGRFALFVSFFPQLVAGPIERAVHLVPQFRINDARFDPQRVSEGLLRMAWGLFKKLVVADTVALYVNTVYNDVGLYGTAHYWLATYFFAFQIYCDFSGYSDIAIGSAKVLGYDLMENFRRPYFAQGIPEFWRRWHISLSTWFKDYLYIPLGGNRVSKARHYINLMAVFVISGAWHGANWTFIVWGFLHGLYQALSVYTAKARERFTARFGDLGVVGRLARTLFCFHLVCFAWIFFRANTVGDAFHVAGSLFGPFGHPLGISDPVGNDRLMLLQCLGACGILVVLDLLQERGIDRRWVLARPVWVRYPLYYALIAAMLFFGTFDSQEFIYFQF